MRPRLAEWMTPVDRAILELLHNEGGSHELVLSPRLLAENSDWSRQTVREHLMTLRDDRGRAYLVGELDVEELESEGTDSDHE